MSTRIGEVGGSQSINAEYDFSSEGTQPRKTQSVATNQNSVQRASGDEAAAAAVAASIGRWQLMHARAPGRIRVPHCGQAAIRCSACRCGLSLRTDCRPRRRRFAQLIFRNRLIAGSVHARSAALALENEVRFRPPCSLSYRDQGP